MIVTDSTEGMDFMGLVKHPAHGKSFVTFSKDEQPKMEFSFDDEKRIIMGVAIAVDQPIYRKDQDGTEYNVYFDKDSSRKIGQKMLANKHMHNVNIDHDMSKVVDGIQLDSLWYVDSKLGVHAPDIFKDQKLKDGSMMAAYFVSDEKEWESIKKDVIEGNITGFSIEGWFDLFEVELVKAKHNKDKQATVVEVMKHVIEVLEDSIEIGQQLTVDMWGEGNPEILRSGEYFLTDGTPIQVDSDGVVIMIDGNGTEGFKKELNKNKMKKFANIKAAVHKFLASDDTPVTFESANTTDGVELFWEGELEVGTAVFIQDEEGNNIQAPEGNHAIQMDDMTVTFSVDNTGTITELEKVDAEPSDEEMEKAIEEALSEFKATQKTAMSAKDTEIKALKEEKKTLSTELTEKSEQCVALQAEMDNGGGKKKPNAGKTSYKDIMFPNRK
jgi:hypothetical protein